MNPQIKRAIAYHANQLAKNFGLQAADKEDIQQELTLKALTIIEDFEEGEASLATYIKRCLENKASDIARDLRGLGPLGHTNDASAAMDMQAYYNDTADRNENHTPFTVSMGGQLQNVSACDHEHQLPLKMDVAAAFSALTPRQRQIAELLEDGKNQGQIAEVLGIAQQTVNRRLKKIKNAFQNIYENYDFRGCEK
jgi:RNA polymerase sigma factor (sigma-70 family)